MVSIRMPKLAMKKLSMPTMKKSYNLPTAVRNPAQKRQKPFSTKEKSALGKGSMGSDSPGFGNVSPM
jgi:hypothetical protein